MAFPSPPPSFLPPAPPRRSRAGAILLLMAGMFAAASPFLAWIPDLGDQASLIAIADVVTDIEGDIPALDNPQNWLYSILGGAACALLFGLIGLAGNRGVNVTAGLFGLLATVAVAFPPVWMVTATGPASGSGITVDFAKLGGGYYAALLAGLLALLGTLFAFIGAAKR